jgi:hypothetical protein
VEVLVRYFLVGFLFSLLTLIPLEWLVGVYALIGIFVFPLLGMLIGTMVWKRACAVVDETYRDVVAAVIESSTKADDGDQVWLSGTSCTGEQYGVEPGQEYTFIRVVRTEDYVSIDKITVDLAGMEMVVQSERILADRVTAFSFENEMLSVESTCGIWNIQDIEPAVSELEDDRCRLRMTERNVT